MLKMQVLRSSAVKRLGTGRKQHLSTSIDITIKLCYSIDTENI